MSGTVKKVLEGRDINEIMQTALNGTTELLTLFPFVGGVFAKIADGLTVVA